MGERENPTAENVIQTPEGTPGNAQPMFQIDHLKVMIGQLGTKVRVFLYEFEVKLVGAHTHCKMGLTFNFAPVGRQGGLETGSCGRHKITVFSMLRQSPAS